MDHVLPTEVVPDAAGGQGDHAAPVEARRLALRPDRMVCPAQRLASGQWAWGVINDVAHPLAPARRCVRPVPPAALRVQVWITQVRRVVLTMTDVAVWFWHVVFDGTHMCDCEVSRLLRSVQCSST